MKDTAINDLHVSEKHEKAYLSHFNCFKTDHKYRDFYRELVRIKFMVDNFKDTNNDTPSNQRRDLNDISKALNKVIDNLSKLDHHQELLNQIYYLNKYKTLENIPKNEAQGMLGRKFSESMGLNELKIVCESIAETASEIQTNKAKTPVKFETVKLLYPYFENNGNGEKVANDMINYLLTISFEILGIDCEGGFKSAIKNVKN
ncbi:hypothetical protein ACOI22_03630 [Glaciecola sp. 2405UD65-10]|uniref:hypothetical protein n=1 Tax=Glaciecola sp. 2405UD65-10 TaxID=3397244 RepID=UPI003B596596